jgi:hypothetical protein
MLHNVNVSAHAKTHPTNQANHTAVNLGIQKSQFVVKRERRSNRDMKNIQCAAGKNDSREAEQEY